MNIFVTSDDPELCAQALDDQRVNKMILESAQMLSHTAHIVYGQEKVYKSVFSNHPCSLWVRRSDENFVWLARHFLYLLSEYKYRFSRDHACKQAMATMLVRCFGAMKDVGEPVTFVNCAANELHNLSFKQYPVIVAYRKYLTARWQNSSTVRWTRRGAPSWFEE